MPTAVVATTPSHTRTSISTVGVPWYTRPVWATLIAVLTNSCSHCHTHTHIHREKTYVLRITVDTGPTTKGPNESGVLHKNYNISGSIVIKYQIRYHVIKKVFSARPCNEGLFSVFDTLLQSGSRGQQQQSHVTCLLTTVLPACRYSSLAHCDLIYDLPITDYYHYTIYCTYSFISLSDQSINHSSRVITGFTEASVIPLRADAFAGALIQISAVFTCQLFITRPRYT